MTVWPLTLGQANVGPDEDAELVELELPDADFEELEEELDKSELEVVDADNLLEAEPAVLPDTDAVLKEVEAELLLLDVELLSLTPVFVWPSYPSTPCADLT